jgi:phosphoribosyl 1,2-cyclic phosphodiesterase
MIIHFWGVRGSLPSPLLPSQIKSKISAILERLTPEDIVSPASRERFLAGLPPCLFGTVGGNTPCVTVQSEGLPEMLVFDAGSGMREMGLAMAKQRPRPLRYHLFFSHFHWDHLQGLPFFYPAYDPAVGVDFYSPSDRMEAALRGQMVPPYFPVPVESLGAKKAFHRTEGEVVLQNLSIIHKKMNHPGYSYSYSVSDGSRRFIYATDTELSAGDFTKNEENTAFFQNADLAVIDAQYTLGEAIEKYNWGHSAFSMAVDFAAHWGIRRLVLFHHDPNYDDQKLSNILQSARWYTERMNIREIEISLAMEGMELKL